MKRDRRNKEIRITSIYVVALFLTFTIFAPSNSLPEKDWGNDMNGLTGKVYSGNEMDDFWIEWSQDCIDSLKIKDEPEEYQYHEFGEENRKNEESTKDEWWNDYYKDKNHNGIDDKIEKNKEESVNLSVRYDHHPTDEDVENLLKFNVTLTYRCKYIDSIFITNGSWEKILEI
ncbi:MAG: hypothetical protein JSV56_05545, partial [Methanomassiliicoccales archaeon]